MPPGGHAKLSPSASERWLSCPASIRMERSVAEVVEVESFYATEGTAAHSMGEIKARLSLGRLTQEEYTASLEVWAAEFPQFVGDADMHEHTDSYVAFIHERRALVPHSQVLLEQRLDTGVPWSWGTSDTVIVSPTHLEIVDLKYGMGVKVEAEGNPQLKLYALGALDAFDGLLGDVEQVTTTIYQPRLGSVSSATMTASELRAWRVEILPIAESALGHDAPFGPSEDACRWCPVSGRCRAQVEAATAVDFAEDPELLSPAEIGVLLEQAPMVKQWLLALEKTALSLSYGHGVPIPGWKVVASGGRRTIPDQEGAIAHLTNYRTPAGDALPPEQFSTNTPKLRTLGELEKLFGGLEGFNAALGDYVVKTEGTPSLVRETDRRKAITPNIEAREEFLTWTE